MKWVKVIVFVFFLPVIGRTSPVMVISEEEPIQRVREYEFFIDSSNSFDIHQVSEEPFYILTKENYSELQNTRVTWIRFNYRNAESIEDVVLFFDQANIDTIEVFQITAKGTWKKTLYGNNLNFGERKYQTTHFIFDLETSKTEKEVYVRIKNNVKTSFNFMIGRDTDIFNHEQNGNILFAIILGVFIVMIFYNLFLYLMIRETVYLIYVVQSFFTAILQTVLFGFSFQYFWPNSIFLQEYGVEFLTTVGTFFGIIFMNSFLKTKTNAPKLFKVSKLLLGLYTLLGILVWFENTLVNAILLGLQPLAALFILGVAINVMLAGYKPARFYLISWSVFLVGILIFVLSEVGVVERNTFTTLTMTMGAGLETVLLSFALANRINILKNEQKEAVSKSFRLEKEKATIIQEQNLVLEQKVVKRTDELEKSKSKLEEKNSEIEEAYLELKSAQSQLVNAEKMSSLGQLTAGIAHEINNPINFVSSNVSPLKRDVEDIIELFERTESIAKENVSPEKMWEIDELKEEVEYEYLVDEINQLLDGMKDGANRTVEIIQGLKLFSRLDEEDLKKVNLEEGLHATLVLLNSNIKHYLEVETHFSGIPNVDCYGGKMNQVFMNILSNAIHAVKSKETQDGKIEISTRLENNNAIIAIKDNGIGMSQDVINKLYEPFFTTKPVGEGTGLGMSIVFTIIEKMNGTIKVNSELGIGTEFILSLPITDTTKPPL